MAMTLEHVEYIYNEGTPMQKEALKDVCLEIGDGQFIGLIGHTGSGKSTLIQHMNGLIRATSGDILYNGESIYSEGYSMKDLRTKVGLVFQYPEYQLFEEDVFTDVCFGPKNQGLSKDEVCERARWALSAVGLGESYYKKSPFDISGGEKRRAAIAGVLAMKPDMLILDEPTAGLDPRGRDDILGEIWKLHKELGMTIVLVSHSMEDVAKYVDRILVMDHGRLALDGTPREVFARYKELEGMGLAAPQVTYIMNGLAQAGLPVDTDVITVDEAEAEICRALGLKPEKEAAG